MFREGTVDRGSSGVSINPMIEDGNVQILVNIHIEESNDNVSSWIHRLPPLPSPELNLM